MIIGLIILAILFAVAGRFILTLPLTLAGIALLKLKGLSIFQIISLFFTYEISGSCDGESSSILK